MTFDGAKIIEQDVPIILASQTDTGFIYNGRKDIVAFLYSIRPQQIPWKRYTLE